MRSAATLISNMTASDGGTCATPPYGHPAAGSPCPRRLARRDTAGTTWDRTLSLVAGNPTVVWVERTKTAAEVTEAGREANTGTLRQRAEAALAQNATFLAIGAPSNAAILTHVRLLTKEVNALIRLVTNLVDNVSDTA